MFLGEYEHSLDAKGRLAIPARFRALLGEGAIITRGFDGCLVIYPADVWRTVAEKLDSLSSTQEAARMAKRFVFSGATECEFDKQGRVLDPSFLRGYGMQGGSGRSGWGRGSSMPGYGASFKESLINDLGPWTLSASGWGETLPNPDNRITIDPTVKDKWDIPVLRFHWKWSDHELNQAVHARLEAP